MYQVNDVTLNKKLTCHYFNKINGYPTAHEHTFLNDEVVQCGGFKERKK
jgi:hypothetical protein